MLGSVIPVPNYHFRHRHFQLYNPTSTSSRCWRRRSCVVSCCKSWRGDTERLRRRSDERNYYELLGVSVDSSAQEIKDAYRKLQKKHHPDIAGQKGHAHTLMLNEAYKVLIREDMRRDYDASIGHFRVDFGRNNNTTHGHGLGYSSWNGPFRPQALFVDENACIGCRECVHHASNTFMMDEALGCARVKVQYGDDDRNIEVSVESCPVNCIYWVEREELQLLELLIKPQPKEGYGIFGQGWERPKNVFMAAKAYDKQLKQEATHGQRNARQSVEQETPAQAEARANASIKLKMDNFSKVWNWVNEILGH